ncbi:MAG: hypothetical protein ACE5GU_13635 [Candidatus Scalinduaceae bacterium]
MNFIYFNGILLFAGFLAVLIFSVGLMAFLSPIALFSKSGNPPKAITIPLFGIAGIYQIYFWGFWSAFCVVMTIRFTQKPNVTWDWLYWIMGFMWCISLIGWLAHKERQESQSLKETQGIQRGTTFYSLIAIATFLLFAFMPSFIQLPYGWALNGLGRAMNESRTSSNVAKIDEETRHSIEEFFNGYEHFVSASNLLRGLLSSKDPLGDSEKAISLLNKTKESFIECDTELLNKAYSGWGDIVSNKFIPSINLYLAETGAKGDKNNLRKADTLIVEVVHG